jgi:hypothetical protein
MDPFVEALKKSTALEPADNDITVRRKVPKAEELCGDLGEIQDWALKVPPIRLQSRSMISACLH